MLNNNANQRRYTRFQPKQSILCTDVNGCNLGRVMNLSESGFMLMSPIALDVSDNIIIRLDLPLQPAHQVTLTTEVVWCQKSSFTEEYGVGIQINSIDDLAKLALRRYLNDDAKATAA